MRIIELDATKWQNVMDFYHALLASVEAPQWHGRSPDALIDSMIWGGINAVEPPYTVRISGSATLPKDVRDHIELVKCALAEARLDYSSRQGSDVEVVVEIVS